jgi:hypothetical protein
MSNDSDVSRRSFLAGAIGAALVLPEKATVDAAIEPPSLTQADFERMMTELLGSVVKLTGFLQKWPKIRHSSSKCLQQSMTFQKSSFSCPAV